MDYVDERLLPDPYSAKEGVLITDFIVSPDFPRNQHFLYVVSGHKRGYYKIGVAHGRRDRGTYRLESYVHHWDDSARIHYIDVMASRVTQGGRSGVSTKEMLLKRDERLQQHLAQGREWYKCSWRPLVAALKRMQHAFETGYELQPVRSSPRIRTRDEILLIELEKKIKELLNSGRVQETRSGKLSFELTDAERAQILGRWT